MHTFYKQLKTPNSTQQLAATFSHSVTITLSGLDFCWETCDLLQLCIRGQKDRQAGRQ